jgi:hypothetical protein
MKSFDPILLREIPVIYKIIQDETWLEGERRGCQVTTHDPAVRENVCRVVLRIGQALRDSIEAQLASAKAAMEPAVVPLQWVTGPGDACGETIPALAPVGDPRGLLALLR